MCLLAASLGTAGAQEQAGSLNPLRGLNKDALTNFRNRPLFNPARSEPHADAPAEAAPVEAAPPVQDPPPDLHLVGIVSGEHSLAVVRLASSGKATILATGDKVGAWSVTVLPSGLRLQANARSVDIALFAPRSAADPVAGKGPDAAPPPGAPPPDIPKP